jgi:lysozyme
MRPIDLTLRTTSIARLQPIAFAVLLPALGVPVQACSSGGAPTECVGETGGQALSVCSTGATVKGVDVSYYQGTVNWPSVKNGGNAFAFVRVADGTKTIDSKFAANWPAVKSAGLIRGAYHFFRASQDPTTQANLFVSHLNASGGLATGDLPGVLDLETADGQSNSTVVSRALTWLSVVEQQTGIRPMVYTAAFMSSIIGTSFSKYPLWVANYQATCPSMPSGWNAWEFWQDSSTGTVAGISGQVDLDLFNGPLSSLQKLTLQAAPADAGTSNDAGAPKDAGTGTATSGSGSGGGVTTPESSPLAGDHIDDQGSAMGAGGQAPYSAPLPSDDTPAPDPCMH